MAQLQSPTATEVQPRLWSSDVSSIELSCSRTSYPESFQSLLCSNHYLMCMSTSRRKSAAEGRKVSSGSGYCWTWFLGPMRTHFVILGTGWNRETPQIAILSSWVSLMFVCALLRGDECSSDFEEILKRPELDMSTNETTGLTSWHCYLKQL